MFKIHPAAIAIFIFLASCGIQENKQQESQTSGIGACKRGHMTQQCVTRTVCKSVCTVAAGAASGAASRGAAVGAGIAAGQLVCERVCNQLPQCTPFFVCDEFERGGP